MPGKPYRSCLIPYEDEIFALRRRRPPTTYAQIADLLRQKYDLTIQGPAIFKFIKVRSRGRKVYGYIRKVPVIESTPPSVVESNGGTSNHRSTPCQGLAGRST